jgi:hypothetical protein
MIDCLLPSLAIADQQTRVGVVTRASGVPPGSIGPRGDITTVASDAGSV